MRASVASASLVALMLLPAGAAAKAPPVMKVPAPRAGDVTLAVARVATTVPVKQLRSALRVRDGESGFDVFAAARADGAGHALVFVEVVDEIGHRRTTHVELPGAAGAPTGLHARVNVLTAKPAARSGPGVTAFCRSLLSHPPSFAGKVFKPKRLEVDDDVGFVEKRLPTAAVGREGCHELFGETDRNQVQVRWSAQADAYYTRPLLRRGDDFGGTLVQIGQRRYRVTLTNAEPPGTLHATRALVLDFTSNYASFDTMPSVLGGTSPPGFACEQSDTLVAAEGWRCTGGPWRPGQKLVFTVDLSEAPVPDRWGSTANLTVEKPVSSPKFSYSGVYGLRIG